MKRLIPILLGSVALTSCNNWLQPPQSLGDKNSGFRYIAIDPLPVSHSGFSKCPSRTSGGTPDVLDALPDISSRVATRLISGEASGAGGPVTVGVSGNTYEVVQDFISYDETNLRFENPTAGGGSGKSMAPKAGPMRLLTANERATGSNREIVVPVYVGVGLRLSATVTVRKGNVGLDFGAISAAARAERVRGGLVVQSLGLNGPKIATLMPLPGELNATTIQNAAVAVGSIKALLYASDTQKWARVVGIHYPFAEWDPAMNNAIVTALATKPIPWKPCESSGTSN